MAEMLQNLYHEYVKAVKQNSPSIAQFESAFRLISYAIAGRFEDSTLISELLYSASNLLVLFNDAIIQKASGILPSVTVSQERLQNLVTVLEYVGVFVEMAAQKMWGDVGRWAAIFMVQLTKAVARFLLLIKHKMGVQSVPPLAPVDRDAIIKQAEKETSQSDVSEEDTQETPISVPSTFTLKRSGKVMRSLTKAPPVNTRDWKLPEDTSVKTEEPKVNCSPSLLSSQQTWGELLYIVKPLLHLSSLPVFGRDSFKPWILSAGLDLGSLCLMGDTEVMNPPEKAELKRRGFMILMYMLRSPFYDRHTKQRLLQILSSLGDAVPGLSLVLGPLMEYLPIWQQIYFYTWSS